MAPRQALELMTPWLKTLLTPPRFDDAERTRQAAILHTLLLAALVSAAIFGCILIPTSSQPVLSATILGSALVAGVLTLQVLHNGNVHTISFFFCLVVWLCLTYAGTNLRGGLNLVMSGAYIFVVIGAGLLLGGKYAFLFAGLSTLSGLALYLADLDGILPPAHILVGWFQGTIYFSAYFMLAALMVYMVNNDIRQALQRARSHERELTEKNRELKDIRQSLELQMNEKTSMRAGEILRQKQFFQALVENSPISIVFLDLNDQVISVNPAFELLFAYSASELNGKDLDVLITDANHLAEAEHFTRRAHHGEAIHAITCRKNKYGKSMDVEIYGVPIKVDDKQIGVLAMYNDVTEQKSVEETLKYLATHDPLTRLPNRSLFYDRLKHALLTAQRQEHPVAVFFLDLDGFKSVNDRYGHEVGDLLLQSVGERLQQQIRQSDTVTRLGGDEFAIIFENINSPADVTMIAEKLRLELDRPFLVNSFSLHISPSIGISLAPQDGYDAETLLKNADAAMYRAKDLGKDNYQFYSQS
jgi:diguanylate cyclase (GGDEF)-like protein/PAS domain S-box-containing protein